MTHSQMPSLTGPREPSDRPPGGTSRCAMRYAMMSRFPSGVTDESLNTGIAWGPVSIAS